MKQYPSLEIVPPLKGMTKDELLNDIRPFIEFNPKYINVTCHRDEVTYEEQPDGSYRKRLIRRRVSETAVCGAIQSEFRVNVVPHLICGGLTAEQIEFQLQDFKFMGISNILALRGDCLTGEKRFSPVPGGYDHANELVGAIRRFEKENGCEGFFRIGVGGYPEKHFEAANMDEDIANLKRKVDAGADYITTQMFFDNNIFFNFMYRVREAGITVPIVPGIMPITRGVQVRNAVKLSGCNVPERFKNIVDRFGDNPEAMKQAGIVYATDQIIDLLANGVKHIHVYSMNKPDVAAGIQRNISEILKA